jgi:hypothetical protein
MFKLFTLNGYLNCSTVFATCFHSYSKLRFIPFISKVIIVEVSQVVTNVEQNHWVLVLKCFEILNLVLILNFIFIF